MVNKPGRIQAWEACPITAFSFRHRPADAGVTAVQSPSCPGPVPLQRPSASGLGAEAGGPVWAPCGNKTLRQQREEQRAPVMESKAPAMALDHFLDHEEKNMAILPSKTTLTLCTPARGTNFMPS